MTHLHVTCGDFTHTVTDIQLVDAESLASSIKADFAVFDDGEKLQSVGKVTPRAAAAVEWNLVRVTDPVTQPDADDDLVAKFFTDCPNHARQITETILAQRGVIDRTPYMLVNRDTDEVYPL